MLRSALAQVGARLMDAVDPALVDRATDALSTIDGVRGSASCGCAGSATGCAPKPTSRLSLA